MISKHIIRSIFSLAVLLFAASCQKDPDGSAPDGNNLTLQVLLPVEGGTKATEDGEKALNENKISTLDVFIYKEGEDACAHYQRIVPVDGMTRYGISKNRSAFAENTGYSVYVVANAGTAAAGAMSLAELKAAVVAQALNPDAVQTDLLMDGKSIATVLNDGTKANKNIDVSLKRGVAKIRVNLSYGADYQPAGQVTKKLVNYASDARVLETGDVHTPALATTASYTGADLVSGEPNQIILYSYANDWNAAVADETFIYLNVPIKKASATESSYYKIPVNYRLSADGGDPAHLYKLRRNYIYNIKAHIDGDGGASAPEAVLLENVDYQVVDWTTNNIEVWIKNIM